jgi:hypothetical protein
LHLNVTAIFTRGEKPKVRRWQVDAAAKTLLALLDERRAYDLGEIDPALHRTVWKVYRCAMRDRHNQHDAFDEALRLVSERSQDGLIDPTSRRLVARMLTHEPPGVRD